MASQRGLSRVELGLPTNPRGISASDDHVVPPTRLLCQPGSGHLIDEVSCGRSKGLTCLSFLA